MKNAMSNRLTALCLAVCLALPLAGCSGKEQSSAANRLEEIQQRGYLEVVTEPYFAPMEFIDPTQEGEAKYVGADIELAHHIADELGVDCHIIPLDFTSVLSGVTTGKYDLAISALAYTPERAEAMELSDGYYYGSEDTGYGLLVRTDALPKIASAGDLADKTVVVQSGSIQESFLNDQVPAVGETKRVSSTTDGFLMVQEGKADAIITAINTAQLYLEANPNCGMSLVPDFRFVEDESTKGTRIGVAKGETELMAEVNRIIAEVREEGLYNQWYEEYTDYARNLGIQ